MDYRNGSYHGNKTEHQFYTEEEIYRMLQEAQRYGYRRGVKKGEESGYEKGFAKGKEEGICQERESEKEKFNEYLKTQQEEREKERKTRVSEIGRDCLLAVGIIWGIAWGYGKLIILFEWFDRVCFGGMLLCVIKPIWSAFTDAKNMGGDTRRQKGLFRTLRATLNKLWETINNNDVSMGLFVIFICLLSGCVIGHFHLIPCMRTAVVDGSVSFGKEFRELNNLQLQNETGTKEENTSEESQQPEQRDEPAAMNQPEQTDILDGAKESFEIMKVQAKEETLKDADVNELSKIEISGSELKQKRELPVKDYNEVFFSGEEYLIEDWDDQDKINEKVLGMVKEARKEKKACILDISALAEEYDIDQTGFEEGEATTEEDILADIKEEISALSSDEKDVKSFQEIERIKEQRKKIYQYYSQQDLANLIANGEHKQALVLLYHNGHQETIQYHYAQSILWNIEYMKHENTSIDKVRERLNFIAARYKDIACVCTECGDSDKALKLQEAFKYAADHIEE